MNEILQIHHLTKQYPAFKLDDISFSIPKGTIMGLIGENGAGKTTTINLILHAIEKDTGTVLVFGKDHIENELEIKQDIGIILDECNLPAIFTAAEVETVMKRIYAQWSHETYAGMLSAFDLPKDQKIGTFSKGMKIKLNLAVALAHEPKLLILDETTAGLDPVMRDDLLDFLLDFVQDEEHAVLFSTHITSDLARIADYITFLHQGKLLFCRKKDDLIYQYGILHCGETAFRGIDQTDILAWQKKDYEYQVLVADRSAAEQKYRDCVIDPATIDDIMLLLIRGEK